MEFHRLSIPPLDDLAETGRSHTTIVWETEESARDFKEMVDESRQRAATFGVTNDFLVVTDVLAEVHR